MHQPKILAHPWKIHFEGIFMKFSIQKASFWKRFSAWLIDAVSIVLLSMVFALATSAALGYDSYSNEYLQVVSGYETQLEEKYGIRLDLEDEEYQKLSPQDKAAYNEKKTQAEQELNELVKADTKAQQLRSAITSLIITMVCISLFFATAVVHFAVPLGFKHGRTLGKKVFGLAVIRTNGLKLSAPVLFIRSFVGLFAIETMAVIFLCTIVPTGLIMAVLVQALQIGVMVKTYTNSAIHDLLADTVVVDFASQRIFETLDEQTAFLTSTDEAEIIH